MGPAADAGLPLPSVRRASSCRSGAAAEPEEVPGLNVGRAEGAAMRPARASTAPRTIQSVRACLGSMPRACAALGMASVPSDAKRATSPHMVMPADVTACCPTSGHTSPPPGADTPHPPSTSDATGGRLCSSAARCSPGTGSSSSAAA